ncbi:guanine nucleotide binding protein, alpha subunit [Gautieria morchelliformis]|nr:guanine nucleotide binding protein, alpha subunit [Gautieria morchelliformis]
MMPGRTHEGRDDPLTRALQAEVAHETEREQEIRLKKEKEARRISETIDERIREEKAALKGSRPVKILLLGRHPAVQHSTALKNFQIIHTPQAWAAERASWRAVIQLNLIRSVGFILDAMTQAQSRRGTLDQHVPQSPERAVSPTFTSDHLDLQRRLEPLLHVERRLIQRLSPAGQAAQLAGAPKLREVSVNALSSWKSVLSKLGHHSSPEGHAVDTDEADAISEAIAAQRDDIYALWTDPVVRGLLEKRKLHIQDLPGFFLDDLDRIADTHYIPSDDDVLRARLKTVGVTEYRFTRETSNAVGSDWRIYDVGGSRTQRAAWPPYFQDVDAIIFLAPISCFDQVLVEDTTVNRLEDTVILWKSLCSNQLLKDCNLVLFMNKTDLLAKKLQAGIRLAKYIPSYGTRANDFTTASSYLKRKFQLIFNSQSPQPRPFYCHMTSLTDMHASAKVIASVADMILHSYLRDHNMI